MGTIPGGEILLEKCRQTQAETALLRALWLRVILKPRGVLWAAA